MRNPRPSKASAPELSRAGGGAKPCRAPTTGKEDSLNSIKWFSAVVPTLPYAGGWYERPSRGCGILRWSPLVLRLRVPHSKLKPRLSVMSPAAKFSTSQMTAKRTVKLPSVTNTGLALTHQRHRSRLLSDSGLGPHPQAHTHKGLLGKHHTWCF